MSVGVVDGPVVRPDQVTLGVLVSREEVAAAIEVCGVREKRKDGELPTHVTTYVMLRLALFPDDGYEESRRG